MLRIDSLHVAYGHVRALRGVSLHVDPGEIVAIFGANGAGKTTTLRAASGLVRPYPGAITFDGNDLAGAAPERIARLGLAHVPQGRGIFPRMSVLANLKMGAYVARPRGAALNRALDAVLAEFPALQPRLAQHAGTLSGGEQQMLALARALISGPRGLLVDEPSHGLAPIVVREVFALLDRVRATGTAVLVVEQFADAALGVADRAYVLERGRVAFEGPAEALRKDRSHLERAYLGVSR